MKQEDSEEVVLTDAIQSLTSNDGRLLELVTFRIVTHTERTERFLIRLFPFPFCILTSCTWEERECRLIRST